MEITTNETKITEMVAPEGCYITQSSEVTDDERLFFTRRPLLATEKLGDWTAVDSTVKDEWQQRMSAKYGNH